MSTESSLLKRHPIKTIMLLLLLVLAFSEITLRVAFSIKRYPLGTLAPPWLFFRQVDSLVEQQSFYTDSTGIYKAKREYWEKQNYIINSDCFRGREFAPDTLNDSTYSLLFIGDSFTWGANAAPPDSCFVDLLEKTPLFDCYNAGIPGTDPAQYALVAKTYIPRLRPDFTLVIVYPANDMMDVPRAIVPNENIYFQTNAGWQFPANYKGHHFSSARESYDYVLQKYSPHSVFEKIFLKTAIGTAILSFPLRLEEYLDWKKIKNSRVTNDYLKQIQSVCEQNNSIFFIFIIPRETDLNEQFYKNPKFCISKTYPSLMTGLENITYVIPFRKGHLYPLPDGHLNNAGHAFAAEFIKSKLQITNEE